MRRGFNALLASLGGRGDVDEREGAQGFLSQAARHAVGAVHLDTTGLKTTLFRYIAGFYNTERIQKDLGWLSPDEYEAARHTAQTETTTILASPTRSR